MRRLAGSIVGAALALATIAPAALAAPPDNACWGVVTQQRAVSEKGIGEHSSAFAGEPRLGLGNVARLFLGDDAKVSDLGTLLASLDNLDATFCP